MTSKRNGYNLDEFGSAILVRAINNCSNQTKEEVADELEKLRKKLI